MKYCYVLLIAKVAVGGGTRKEGALKVFGEIVCLSFLGTEIAHLGNRWHSGCRGSPGCIGRRRDDEEGWASAWRRGHAGISGLGNTGGSARVFFCKYRQAEGKSWDWGQVQNWPGTGQGDWKVPSPKCVVLPKNGLRQEEIPKQTSTNRANFYSEKVISKLDYSDSQLVK